MTSFNTEVFLFGGIIQFQNKEIYLDDFWSFNTITSLWKKISPNGQIPSTRSGNSLNSKDYKLYIFGGKNNTIRFNDIYEFDTNKNTFIKIESITNHPIPRTNHTAEIIDNSLIIFGGWDGTKTLNDMYEYSISIYIFIYRYKYILSYQLS